MISVHISYIATTLGWRVVGNDAVINNVCTDSRAINKGDCFIALYGDSFDAHAFIPKVIEQGASVLIVSCEQEDCSVPQLVVDDTRLALAQLAGLVKSLANVKTIAITGSCGKTTVKEMISAILSQDNKVLATKGNFNNDIGAPLTLLRLTKEHQYAVIELGANHVGEIDFTSKITQPDVAIITNIGAAHLEGFGGISGVVKAKSEIFNHLTNDGCAIFDGESEYSQQWREQNKTRSITAFSQTPMTDERAIWSSNVTLDEQGCAQFVFNRTSDNETDSIQIILPIPGLHNVKNALAAGAAVLALGFNLQDIANGLKTMSEVKGRLNLIAVTERITVIDDTYNANSSSITAAINVLANNDGYKILVLGDMAELGEFAVESHQSLGAVIEDCKIDLLLTFGHLSHHYGHGFTGTHHHFDNKNELNLKLIEQLTNVDATKKVTVLVKGSRSAAMESVVEYINNNKNNIGATIQC